MPGIKKKGIRSIPDLVTKWKCGRVKHGLNIVCWCAGVLVCWGAGVLACWCAGVLAYWGAGVSHIRYNLCYSWSEN